ncbi:MAG: DNA alkylation repair protein [Gemmiger sp.]|uniref:DNA alkylation repair protein n=1 Tax=Gemmiger sp. TaxID=2049027 RepID=UPI002A81043B|nr:DNA alkylation repair protein [Gemmiger sp.]MCI6175648.1 DNA alkylation repair protein [bacterium]MCI6247393.1 DNA alkylation repair protein [bacterium]MDY4879213.1 DNA alkylation repair protein [Gemmiger sp.]
MPTQSEIITQLSAMAEPEYAAFASRLIPGCPPMLGVRLPALRRYAAKLARDPAGPQAVVAQLGPEVFETRMLRGMVIGCAKLPSGERWRMLEDFLPLADNWSLCDSTAAGCRFMAKAPGFWLPRLQELARRDQEFPARFGLVCLLDHFTGTPEGRRLTLDACAAAPCPGLYTRLGAAWAVSVVAVKEPELGLAFLRTDPLDDFTHNKAIQKIRESRRATEEYRAAVLALKR